MTLTLDQEITALEERKAKLQRMMDLRGEVAVLEVKLVLGGGHLVQTARAILEIVADYYHLNPQSVLGRCRLPAVCHPRHVCFFLVQQQTRASLASIGHILGKWHHTTVLHGIRCVRRRLATEPDFQRELAQLTVAAGKAVNGNGKAGV